MPKNVPGKLPQPKRQRLSLTTKQQWETLLKEVNKEEVPVNVLLALTVNLKDGSTVDVNIEEMLRAGADPEAVEKMLNEKLDELDDYINDVDFYVSVELVADFIQPVVDQLLKDL